MLHLHLLIIVIIVAVKTEAILADNAIPPQLPNQFSCERIQTVVQGAGPARKSNITLFFDLPREMQYIRDYTEGPVVQSWSLLGGKNPRIYTWDPIDIPPPSCVCIHQGSSQLLPEFLPLSNASYGGTAVLRGIKCAKWVVSSALLPGDTYTVWVVAKKNSPSIPLRTQWIDPGTKGTSAIVETNDYFHFMPVQPPTSIFTPKGPCKTVKCG
eukprot:g3126.t1